MRKKIILIGGILFLLIGIAVTTLFLRQNQDNRQRAAESPLTKHPKVLVISYYPRDASNTNNLDTSATGENVTVAQKQSYVDSLVSQLITNLTNATSFHKYKNSNASNYLTYSVYDTINIYEKIPRGYILKPTEGIYRPDYGKILRDASICNMVDNQNVKEVWMFGYHYGDIEPSESKMSSKYGDISNAGPKEEELPQEYRIPLCNNSYVLYNYNYERTANEMIHNRIHQLENIIPFIEGKWPPSPVNRSSSLFWNDFSEYVQSTTVHNYKISCGNAHYTPNWKTVSDEYNYTSQNYAENNCETWDPDDSKTTYVNANCSQWGCTEVGFYLWFMQNMPGYNNCIIYQGQNMRNWWDAMYDFNAFIDKGKALYSSEQNCGLPEPPIATLTPTAIPTITATISPSATSIPTVTIPSGGTGIQIVASIPGIGLSDGENHQPLHPDRTITVILSNFTTKVQTGSPIQSSLTYDSATGKFKGTVNLGASFTTGAYDVKIKMDNTLFKKQQNIMITAESTVNQLPAAFVLVPGDLDQDNRISISDYTIALACVKEPILPACTPSSVPLSDINDNGANDYLDMVILQRGFETPEGN